MKLNIATYTAEKGLSWFYDKSAISFAELDKCRRLLGHLPDFDAGDSGYEGVAAFGGIVFVIRCISAPKWDFMGRNATFMRVAWLERQHVSDLDIGKILASEAFCEFSHEYKYTINIECELSQGDESDWAAYSQTINNESYDVFIRRDFGRKDMAIKVVKKGVVEMTEAEKFLSGKTVDSRTIESDASASMSRDLTPNNKALPYLKRIGANNSKMPSVTLAAFILGYIDVMIRFASLAYNASSLALMVSLITLSLVVVANRRKNWARIVWTTWVGFGMVCAFSLWAIGELRWPMLAFGSIAMSTALLICLWHPKTCEWFSKSC